MRYQRSSVTAVIMIITALLGWGISIVGFFGTWSLYPKISSSANNLIGLARRSLDTTTRLLDVVDNTLKTTAETTLQIQTSLEDVSKSFGNTAPLFGSASEMVSKDFSKMAEDTRVALVSLASTAKVIDDTLRFLSSFPLIGQSYNPPVPLDTSINNLASGIEKLPANLKDIQSWLTGTGKDLATLKEDTAQLAKSMAKITPQVTAATQVMVQYRGLVQDLKSELTVLEARISQALSLLAVSISIFLLWLALAQISTFSQGLERLRAIQIDENIAAAAEPLKPETEILDNSEISSSDR